MMVCRFAQRDRTISFATTNLYIGRPLDVSMKWLLFFCNEIFRYRVLVYIYSLYHRSMSNLKPRCMTFSTFSFFFLDVIIHMHRIQLETLVKNNTTIAKNIVEVYDKISLYILQYVIRVSVNFPNKSQTQCAGKYLYSRSQDQRVKK